MKQGNRIRHRQRHLLTLYQTADHRTLKIVLYMPKYRKTKTGLTIQRNEVDHATQQMYIQLIFRIAITWRSDCIVSLSLKVELSRLGI